MTTTIDNIEATATKRCSCCKRCLDRSAFNKNRSNGDGLNSHCKECRAAYRAANPEKFKAKDAAYRAANSDKIKACRAAYRAANPEKFKAKDAAYRAANSDKIKACRAAYRAANPEKFKAKDAAYRAANSDKIKAYRAAYSRNRRRVNPNFRLVENLRNRFNEAITRNSSSAKRSSAVRDLGCTIEQFWQMNQSDLDRNGWTRADLGVKFQIDHIVPFKSHDLKCRGQQLRVLHYSNLGVISPKDNNYKRDTDPDHWASFDEQQRAWEQYRQ